MSGVEVLAPVRLETRFRPPDAAAGQATWRLQLRVYPDEFSIERHTPVPSRDELDRLDEALAAPFQTPPVDEAAAFSTLAAAVGSPRAVWLRRTIPVIQPDPARAPKADRSSAAAAADPTVWPTAHLPNGLPPALEVWLVPAGGAPSRAAIMAVDRTKVAADLDLHVFSDQATLVGGDLPLTWWTSFVRAKEVGLGVEIDLGAAPPELDAVVVVGLGDTAAGELVAAHAAAGRLAILAPGTPTNTVAGEPTTELGRNPDAWLPLVAADPTNQAGTIAVAQALTGATNPAFPLLGGDLDQGIVGATLVAALWPVLWARSIRDVAGAGGQEPDIATWAAQWLAPEGPYPAIRVGEQPYGLLPVSSVRRWAVDAANPDPGENAVLGWVDGWRQMAATAAGATALVPGAAPVVGADSDRLLALLGQHAPTPAEQWGARVVVPLALARALRVQAGLPPVSETAWDDLTAQDLAGIRGPSQPISPVSALFPLPVAANDRFDVAELLDGLLRSSPGELLGWQQPLGLLGHLVRESLILARAAVGQAFLALSGGTPIDPRVPLPLWPTTAAGAPDVNTFLANGNDANVHTVAVNGGPPGTVVVRRLQQVMEATHRLIDLLQEQRPRVFAALDATLDTSAFRVDPWVTGVAARRLRMIATSGGPFTLGCYGWVDQPRPSTAAPGSPPRPGPTAAGLLHAPSTSQALTAALLRDAAISDPADDRWSLTIDSSKVRAATRLAERVRLGVHPYEALGLEVERLVGEWNAVRALRQAFPLNDADETRRTCDGARVLRAVLHGAEPVPAGLPVDLATRLLPLDSVLDTYGDLLIADGVHALVSGRGDLANAAMEAAAGLGAPPELRAIRTPRASAAVRVSAWAVLPARGGGGPGGVGGAGVGGVSPAVAADTAFAALLDAEIGPASAWTWTVTGPAGTTAVSLADRARHGADILDLAPDALHAVLQGPIAGPVTIVSTGGADRLAAAGALADLLGGGDGNPPIPGPSSGRDDTKMAPGADPLRPAMLADLAGRRDTLVGAAQAVVAQIDATNAADPAAAAATLALAEAWRLDDSADSPGRSDADRLAAARAALVGRVVAATGAAATVNGLRLAIRALAGVSRIPVLPVVPRAALPALVSVPAGADGHPATDRAWLEIVAAVHARLALLEARQLDPASTPWPAAVAAADGSTNPWAVVPVAGSVPAVMAPVVVAYGPAVVGPAGDSVALSGLDAWVDSVPSRRHATSAAFGFNGPKARAPQAVLLAVPPDLALPMTTDTLVDIVLETRLLVRARAARPDQTTGSRVATPAPLLRVGVEEASFFERWAQP